MLNNDRVGGLSLPAGRLPDVRVPGHGRELPPEASRLFRTFLGEQNLERGYFVTPATGVFSKGRKTPIFRVKPASPRGRTAR